MARPQTVLVGIDGSPSSLHALDWAAAFALRFGWSLHLVTSYALPSFNAATLEGGYAALDDAAIQASARQILLAARDRVSDLGVPLNASATIGDPAGVLVAMSKTHGMVVVGTRGKGGFADRLLGTVSAALPAHAHCPVVVVPHRKHTAGLVPVAHREGRSPVVERIVVGVDGSKTASTAMRAAIDQAQGWGAELVAVAGVPVGGGSALPWIPAQLDHEKVLADVRAGLDSAMDRYERENPGLKIRRVVLDGTGAELLTEFSAAADLLVVGSRGRGGFRGLLLGSTSQAVLHHSACPVMVIPRRAG